MVYIELFLLKDVLIKEFVQKFDLRAGPVVMYLV